MQFLCFKPERSSLRFQFRHAEQSSEENAWFRALPSASPMLFRNLFGNCVVGFDVVSANTSAGSNELTDNSSSYRICGIVFAKSIIASPNRAVRSSKS